MFGPNQKLPVELMNMIADYLSGDDLRSFGLANKYCYGIVKVHTTKRVTLRGCLPAVNFFEHFRRQMDAQCQICARPVANNADSKLEGLNEPHCASCLGRDFRDPRNELEHIREWELQEIVPMATYKVYRYLEGPDADKCFNYYPGYNEDLKPHRNPEDFAGNLIGACVSLCPNLEVLRVTKTPVMVMPALTSLIRKWCINLREFTYVGRAFDAASMAFLLEDVPTLETLEVTSVKTCHCQGEEAAEEAVELLGKALKAHEKLTRLSFTASRVLSIEDGRLLDILSTPTSAEDVVMADGAAPVKVEAPYYGELKLKSLEFHRCQVPGEALSKFLASPAAAHLKHLYIGGCKAVKAEHLAGAVTWGTKGLIASKEPLELEIDANLMSKALFKALKHRITRLRIFEPRYEHYRILTKVLFRGFLPRMASIVILPDGDELGIWGLRSFRFNGTQLVRSSVWGPAQLTKWGRANMKLGKPDWYPRWGHLRMGLQKWLDYADSPADLSVGDQTWQEMREMRAKLGYWQSQGAWEALDLEKYGDRRRSVSPSVWREDMEARRRERRHSPFPCTKCRVTI